LAEIRRPSPFSFVSAAVTWRRRALTAVAFSAALLEFLVRRGWRSLRVDLNNQNLSVVVGSWRGVEPLRGVTTESEYRSFDARLRRRPRKEVDEEAGHLLEGHERAQSSRGLKDEKTERVRGKAERSIEREDAGTSRGTKLPPPEPHRTEERVQDSRLRFLFSAVSPSHPGLNRLLGVFVAMAEEVSEEESGESKDETSKVSLYLVERTLVARVGEVTEDLVDSGVNRRSDLGALGRRLRPVILLLELPLARAAEVPYYRRDFHGSSADLGREAGGSS